MTKNKRLTASHDTTGKMWLRGCNGKSCDEACFYCPVAEDAVSKLASFEDADGIAKAIAEYDDLEIAEVCRGSDDSILIYWDSPSIGFGEFCMGWDNDNGVLMMDTECMSDEFVMALLAKLVPRMKRIG